MNKPNHKDVFGQLVWDFYINKTSIEFIERDDNYIDIGEGKDLYFAPYNNWKEIEKEAIKYATGKILDIGCGAGRHSIYLQNLGLNVTGIDNSKLVIKVARRRGLKKTIVADIKNIHNLRDKYNSFLLLGNNFGLFGTPIQTKEILKKMAMISLPGAIIITETHNPYKIKNSIYASYRRQNQLKGRMSGQSKIRIRYKNLIGSWFEYLSVSQRELRMLLKNTDWQVEKIISSKGSGFISIIRKR